MLQPRQYQRTVIERGIQTNLLVALQMGLGKSLVGLEISKALFNRHNTAALICCPLGIKLQWSTMVAEQDPNARIFIPTKEPFGLLFQIDQADFVIMHYELLVRHIDVLSRYTFSTFILDEGHRIKNRKALRTLAVKKIKCARKLCLTGTPFDKDPSELYSILNFLAPKEFTSYWRFFEQHVNFDIDFLGYKKNLRIKNPQAFADMLKPHAVFMKKSQVMPQIPKMQITHVPIELGQTQRKAYEKIKHVVDMEVNFDELVEPMFIQHALTKLVRLLQCASDPAGIGLSAASAKLDWLIDWCADNPHEPVLIFSRYRATAERAAAVLGADVLIMGGMELTRPLVSAQRIVATIGAAAVGFDLGHLSTAIFIDCDFSSILMQQSMERIDRGGNTEPKQLIFLEAQNTVDSLVRQALDSKWSTKALIDAFLVGQNHGVF